MKATKGIGSPGILGIRLAGLLGLMAVLGGCYGPCYPPCAPRVVTRTPCTPRVVPCVRPVLSRSNVAGTTATPEIVPAAQASQAASEHRATSLAYTHPGFRVYEEDGRLWVFREGSDALQGFLAKGEPAKRVTRIGVGTDDKTVMSDDGETIDAYLAATRYAVPGYSVEIKDGRLWVFETDSGAYAEYQETGEPAKRVTRIGQGPHDLTVIGPDGETLDGYIATARYGRPGFATFIADGRLWVFREGSQELAEFRDVGEPAKRVTRIGSGPDERSIIAPDGETIDAYMATWR
jgi:hypothetical protein